jgi:anti-sigma-K factor RskA
MTPSKKWGFMNIDELHKKWLAAARANPPGDSVPYAFEKRVTALLAARAATDPLALWVRGLWRAAVACVAIALLLGAWAFSHPTVSARADDLSQNFENTLLASVDQNDLTQ